jgi:ABC-type Na+ efflux pump permease subunit
MRRVVSIARLDFQQLLRDRGQLVSYLVLPLLLTWVFGLAFGGGQTSRATQIPVADNDHSVYSRYLIVSLDQTATYAAVPMSEDAARTQVRTGNAPVAVIIPAGFGREV